MTMIKASTLFLQVVIVLVGAGALAVLLIEPTHEGRNAHATLFQVYFNDPFLACAYTASIALFIALYQAFKLLGHARRGEVISPRSVKAFRTIKYCGIAFVGFLLGAEAYFGLFRRGEDDIAGGVMLGLLLIFVCAVVVAIADVFEGIMQNVVELKL